jgi:hypothetical protein
MQWLLTTFLPLGDRKGEKSSGGRDIGLQVQGDLIPECQWPSSVTLSGGCLQW